MKEKVTSYGIILSKYGIMNLNPAEHHYLIWNKTYKIWSPHIEMRL